MAGGTDGPCFDEIASLHLLRVLGRSKCSQIKGYYPRLVKGGWNLLWATLEKPIDGGPALGSSTPLYPRKYLFRRVLMICGEPGVQKDFLIATLEWLFLNGVTDPNKHFPRLDYKDYDCLLKFISTLSDRSFKKIYRKNTEAVQAVPIIYQILANIFSALWNFYIYKKEERDVEAKKAANSFVSCLRLRLQAVSASLVFREAASLFCERISWALSN
jgi:hypothetical protein